MLIEPPHRVSHGVREFLREYAMIVVSILTALLLEHAAVGMDARASARASRARIEAELARNLASVRDAEATNRADISLVTSVMRIAVEKLSAGDTNSADFVPLMTPISAHVGFSLPTWQRSAWDAAIADQSASHLNPRDLVRYAEIYANAQDAIDTDRQLISGDWFSAAAALSVSLHTKAPDVRGLVTMLVRYVIVAQQVEAQIEALAADIVDKQRGAAAAVPAKAATSTAVHRG